MHEEKSPQEEDCSVVSDSSSIDALEEYFELSARTRFMLFPRWME